VVGGQADEEGDSCGTGFVPVKIYVCVSVPFFVSCVCGRVRARVLESCCEATRELQIEGREK